MHFQDAGVYGRIVHLQPVRWQDGWPLMGKDVDGDGIGEPVSDSVKPDLGPGFPESYPVAVPQTSDEFDSDRLGLQWQWHANPNPDWYSLNHARPGYLRLYTVRNPTQFGNLRFVPNLLLQKFPAPAFSATTKIVFSPDDASDKSGLVVMGQEWAYLALYASAQGVRLGMFTGHYEQYDDVTEVVESMAAVKSAENEYTYYLKVDIKAGGEGRFSYSLDGSTFQPSGKVFQATKGVWIGAKVGLFSLNPNIGKSDGYADFDWFHVN